MAQKSYGVPSAGVSILQGSQTPVAPSWYTFFANLYNSLGSGNAPVTANISDQSGAGLDFSAASVNYVQIDNLVFVYGTIPYPTTGSTSNATISLPVAVPTGTFAQVPALVFGGGVNVALIPIQGTMTAGFFSVGTEAPIENITLSGKTLSFMLIYPAS